MKELRHKLQTQQKAHSDLVDSLQVLPQYCVCAIIFIHTAMVAICVKTGLTCTVIQFTNCIFSVSPYVNNDLLHQRTVAIIAYMNDMDDMLKFQTYNLFCQGHKIGCVCGSCKSTHCIMSNDKIEREGSLSLYIMNSW